MAYALFTIDQDVNYPEIAPYVKMRDFRYVDQARKELCEWLIESANSENANEIQPTMNFKDKYHMYITDESGLTIKRTVLIAKVKYDDNAYSYNTMRAVDRAMETNEPLKYNYIKRHNVNF